MTYHEGTPLVNSIFTSRHMLDLNKMSDSPSSYTPFDPLRPPELVHLVLRVYLLMYNLCLHLVWHELARGNGNVYDGEDFMSDTAGLWRSGEEWPVGDMSLDDILDMYEDATQWLEASEGGYSACGRTAAYHELTWCHSVDMECKSHLQKRLAVRKVSCQRLALRQRQMLSSTSFQALLLYTIDDLSGRNSPVTQVESPADAMAALSRLPDLPMRVSQSEVVEASFDKRVCRRLRQAMPLPEVNVKTTREAFQAAEELARGLELAGQLGRVSDLRIWRVSVNTHRRRVH
jgi:hypothetical protein